MQEFNAEHQQQKQIGLQQLYAASLRLKATSEKWLKYGKKTQKLTNSGSYKSTEKTQRPLKTKLFHSSDTKVKSPNYNSKDKTAAG